MDTYQTYQYAWFKIGIEGHTFDPGWRVVPGVTGSMPDENGALFTCVLIERNVTVE